MQQIILSIPEPCHENWQQMTSTQQGRYCNACSKQVVDFSVMSDAEVLHYFSNLQNENVCGRTYPDQLERTIAMPVYPKKKLFWYWNYITMFFLFFAKSNSTKAQGGIKVITEQKINTDKLVDISNVLQGRVGGIKNSDKVYKEENFKHTFLLEVIDNATMQPVNKAAVTINKSVNNFSATAFTDNKGIYKLRSINENEIYIITIAADGYKSESLKIKGSDLAERKTVKQIFLEKGATLADYKKMDSVVINSYPAVVGRLKQYTTSCENVTMGALISGITITRTFTDTLNLLSTKITGAIKIYPNPVFKGNSFNLALKLKETGVYKMQITDALGRIVLIKQINTVAKSYTEQVQTNAAWSSGIYYLSISNPKNILISTGSFSLK